MRAIAKSPDATSITYTVGGQLYTKPTGPDGAYLIVGPPTPRTCDTINVRGHRVGFCGNGYRSSPGLETAPVGASPAAWQPRCHFDRPLIYQHFTMVIERDAGRFSPVIAIETGLDQAIEIPNGLSIDRERDLLGF